MRSHERVALQADLLHQTHPTTQKSIESVEGTASEPRFFQLQSLRKCMTCITDIAVMRTDFTETQRIVQDGRLTTRLHFAISCYCLSPLAIEGPIHAYADAEVVASIATGKGANSAKLEQCARFAHKAQRKNRQSARNAMRRVKATKSRLARLTRRTRKQLKHRRRLRLIGRRHKQTTPC